MLPELRDLIIRQLDEHRIMTVATNRADGWPQATIVGYVNDGFKLYCFVSRLSQKYGNISRDPRVSVAIGNDFAQPLDIKGLSLAGKAAPVDDPQEFEHACELFLKRYPEYATFPRPTAALSPILRITPEIVSILDYSKGFGHSDLVVLSRDDLLGRTEPQRHHWFGASS